MTVPAQPTRPDAERDQEGAISVFAAFATVIALLAATLAIDLGSQALAERDMQGAVDLAALDAVLALGQGGDPQALAEEYALASLAANDGYANKDGRTVTVLVGTFDELTGTFTPTTSAPDAVLVEAVADLSRFGIVPGTDDVRHQAVAKAAGMAAISIGTSVGSIDSDRSAVLDRLLGTLLGEDAGFGLDVVSYQGLASGTISLQQLAADLGLASPSELTDTTVDVASLFTVAASGLSSSGDPLDVAASTPLGTIGTSLSTPLSIDLGTVLDLEVGTVGALVDAEVNVLDLVTVVAQAVNGSNLVDLGMPISVPGVGTGTLSLAMLETPQLAVGRAGIDPDTGTWRTVARTAQLRLGVDLQLEDLDLGDLRVSALHLPLVVEAARGEAPLETVTCASGGAHPVVTSPVSTSGVVTTLGDPPPDLVGAPSPVPVDPADIADVELTLPLLGGTSLASVTGSAQHTVAPWVESLTFVGPYAESRSTAGSSSLGGSPRVPGSDGDGRVGLAAAVDSADLGVSGLSGTVDVQTDVLDPLLDAATPILDEVDERVVGPLLESLGVSLGSSDVTVSDVDCGGRLLVR